jgi:hypothetical protein
VSSDRIADWFAANVPSGSSAQKQREPAPVTGSRIVAVETLADGRTAIAVAENGSHQVVILTPETLGMLTTALCGPARKRRWRR